VVETLGLFVLMSCLLLFLTIFWEFLDVSSLFFCVFLLVLMKRRLFLDKKRNIRLLFSDFFLANYF